MLDLSQPKYLSTAAYGHFGRNFNEESNFTWEQTDKAKLILDEIK